MSTVVLLAVTGLGLGALYFLVASGLSLIYGLMHVLAQPGWEGTRGGLIHVPWLPEQGQPSMRLDEIVAGLERGIACALRTDRDIRKEAGAIA